VTVKKKGPPNEQALRDHAKQLTEQQLDEMLIGRDLESIFVSERDKEPFQIVFGQMLNPGGDSVAVIYEKTGANGTKYVALSIGYAEEYDEETLRQYLPKKK
jgi:ABC-type sulfate transport system substrate-binding protein